MPTYTTLESIYGLNLNKVLTGEMSPEDCAKETALLWTNVLKGNFMIPYQLKSYDDTVDAAKSAYGQSFRVDCAGGAMARLTATVPPLRSTATSNVE